MKKRDRSHHNLRAKTASVYVDQAVARASRIAIENRMLYQKVLRDRGNSLSRSDVETAIERIMRVLAVCFDEALTETDLERSDFPAEGIAFVRGSFATILAQARKDFDAILSRPVEH